MRRVTIRVSLGLLTCSNLALGQSSNQNRRLMQQIPNEPFSSDAEILGTLSEATRETGQNESVRSPQGSTFGLQLRVQMTPEGFGGQFRLLQYARPWLAVTETFRYLTQEEATRVFDRRYAAFLGAELHPWRGSLLSPLAGIQAGWERLDRREYPNHVDLFSGEFHAGVELALNDFSSLAVQWVEATYVGLEEPMDRDLKHNDLRQARVEVHFSMQWEKAL